MNSEAVSTRGMSRCTVAFLVAVLLVHAGILAYSATQMSAVTDEPAHLVAGLSHWKFFRFDLYRVNPPLVRMIAALPVLALPHEVEWPAHGASPSDRIEFPIGTSFMKENGARSMDLLIWARWACIPFSLCGAVFCFLWSREIWNCDTCGAVSLCLWSFDPNVLAHGTLITPDCAAAAFGIGAAYFHWRWMRKLTWKRAFVAGVLLGIALLTKSTWITLFAFLPAIYLASTIVRRTIRRPFCDGLSETSVIQLSAILLIGLFCLNVGYGFAGSFQALKDFTFVSQVLSGSASDQIDGNRFRGTWVGTIPVPLPKDYLIGIDVQKHDFEEHMGRSYLRGTWQTTGWWYYYVYALAIKTPISSILLFGMSCLWFCRSSRNDVTIGPQGTPEHVFAGVLLLGYAITIVVLVSSQVGFNRHVRYVLPAQPFLFVFSGLSGRWLKRIPEHCEFTRKVGLLPPFRSTVASGFVIGCLCCTCISSAMSLPHQLAYFNAAVGGMNDGHRHLLHSNLDWGQSLLQLDAALARPDRVGKVAIAYSGSYNPEWIGARVRTIDWYRRPTPLSGFDRVAISANILQGQGRAYPWYRRPLPAAAEFEEFYRGREPIEIVGGSIFIFDTKPYIDFWLSHKDAESTDVDSHGDAVSEDEPTTTSLTLARIIGSREPSISECLHILLLYGFGETGMNSPRTGAEALEFLTNEQAGMSVFGTSPLVETRHGIRFKLSESAADNRSKVGEAHRDQCLGVFASLKLPLTTPVRTSKRDYTFQDMLNESIANFTYHQSELPWTMQAYVHYVSPAKQWTNRFGVTTTFSDLTNEILDRGLAGQSCAGTHVLDAVASVVAADDHSPILDRATRARARSFLVDTMEHIRASQQDDGSWTHLLSTSASTENESDISRKLLATGHMAEFLQHHATSDTELIDNANEWLRLFLSSDYSDTSQFSVCPLTHALRAVHYRLEPIN
jgi:hypothetical protein